MPSYLTFNEFIEKARFKDLTYSLNEKLIKIKEVPTSLSGEIDWGILVEEVHYEPNEKDVNKLTSISTTENKMAKIIRFSDETIDTFNLNDLPELQEKKQYGAIIIIATHTTIIEGQEKTVTLSRETYILDLERKDEFNGEDECCIDFNSGVW